jgi:hypothetical protein
VLDIKSVINKYLACLLITNFFDLFLASTSVCLDFHALLVSRRVRNYKDVQLNYFYYTDKPIITFSPNLLHIFQLDYSSILTARLSP